MDEILLSCGGKVKKEGEFIVFKDKCWTISIHIETIKMYSLEINKEPNRGFFKSGDTVILTHNSAKITLSLEDYEKLNQLFDF